MTFFISGGAKNGKSSLAQQLAVQLAGGERHVYVATMIPTGEEDQERIHRHVADRAGMDFETIECSGDITAIADPDTTFLVDSVTALMQNALFPPENGYKMDLAAAERCIRQLTDFTHMVRHAVFVSDFLYADAETYSETTEAYRQALARADRLLAAACDTVVEMCAGCPIVYKGELPR